VKGLSTLTEQRFWQRPEGEPNFSGYRVNALDGTSSKQAGGPTGICTHDMHYILAET